MHHSDDQGPSSSQQVVQLVIDCDEEIMSDVSSIDSLPASTVDSLPVSSDDSLLHIPATSEDSLLSWGDSLHTDDYSSSPKTPTPSLSLQTALLASLQSHQPQAGNAAVSIHLFCYSVECMTYTARLLWPAMWNPIAQLLHWYLHLSNHAALVR